MQIFVDADACPVVAIVEKIAKENSVPVTLLCDTNHVLSSAYSEVVVVVGYTSGGAPYGVTWEEMGLKLFNLLLDFIRAWDFGNTEILKLFF